MKLGIYLSRAKNVLRSEVKGQGHTEATCTFAAWRLESLVFVLHCIIMFLLLFAVSFCFCIANLSARSSVRPIVMCKPSTFQLGHQTTKCS